MLPSTSVRRTVASLSQACRPLSCTVVRNTRSFASVVPDASTPVPAESSQKSTSKVIAEGTDGRLRPHLGIEVNPNHGLYAFFRKKPDDKAKKDSSEGEGEAKMRYETLEVMDAQDNSGRSWTAAELRRKSFKDLHTLWYVLLRERNLLATQKEELRRMTIGTMPTSVSQKAHRVRKSMARIKAVINERRLAYEGAVQIHEQKREELLAAEQAERDAHTASLKAEAEEREQAKRAEEETKREINQGKQSADTLAAGLFDAVAAGPSGTAGQGKSAA